MFGGNDCEANLFKSADAILKSYSELIDVAIEKCQTVKVISILCLRLNSKDIQDRIDAVNAGMVYACNVEKRFHLADGTINDGYIFKDGIHITRNAMNKSAYKVKLHIQDHIKNQTNKSMEQDMVTPKLIKLSAYKPCVPVTYFVNV